MFTPLIGLPEREIKGIDSIRVFIVFLTAPVCASVVTSLPFNHKTVALKVGFEQEIAERKRKTKEIGYLTL